MRLQLLSPVSRTVDMGRSDGNLWSVRVPGLRPGQRYGFRAEGPCIWPDAHNANKLLLDPCAGAISGYLDWHPATAGDNDRDSTGAVPHSVLVERGSPRWERPSLDLRDAVVYEAHVKGLTAMHPAVPPAVRGTYAGIAHPAVIEHLTTLGVNVLQLLPVHSHIDETHLLASGRSNYWGYSTVGFFAPHHPWTACTRVEDGPSEFRAMVRALHAAGIEVWLDVVYNHTGEQGRGGPTLGFRGLDNRTWYRTKASGYDDVTGCGNTLDVREAVVRDFIVDSLVYWVDQMGVDGFRFDLAVALARTGRGVDFNGPLFRQIRTTPALQKTRLIAEPWDLGPRGYGVGRFGPRWLEWNGQYRDAVRDLWAGTSGALPSVAQRLIGSPDLYATSERGATASVNFITCHDGFTLFDLVRYEHKHNAANGENNRDGSNGNRSNNHGVEGPSADPAVESLRARIQRGFLATLLLSQGTPMLLGGDELGRTQHGNNNAYCQDNALSWFDWDHIDEALLDFTRQCIAVRQACRAITHNTYAPGVETEVPGQRWRRPSGKPMTDADWRDPATTAVLLRLSADTDDDVLIAVNSREATELVLPRLGGWRCVLNSAVPDDVGEVSELPAHSVLVFRPDMEAL